MPDEPENQSPETIIEEDSPVTIGEIADAVVEKLKGLIPGVGATPDTGSGSSDGDPKGKDSAGSAQSAPPPPAPHQTPSPATVSGESVESTVRRILAEKDTDTRLTKVEESVNREPEPKPQRKGLAAAIFGKER